MSGDEVDDELVCGEAMHVACTHILHHFLGRLRRSALQCHCNGFFKFCARLWAVQLNEDGLAIIVNLAGLGLFFHEELVQVMVEVGGQS